MTPADLVSITASVIEFVVGIALIMYILLVYIGNLKSGHPLGPSDKVHLTKALVTCSLHLTMIAQITLYAFCPQVLHGSEAFLWKIIMIMFLMYYTYWLTAVLCVYYCTNISSSGHHSIVWLKRNLSSYLLHILLLLGLGSFAINCPLHWIYSTKSSGNTTNPYIAIQETFLQHGTYKITSAVLGCFLPFTIAFVSTTFASWSLINHMWRMKQNNWGFSKFQAQINATRTMVLFLLISLIYGVTQLVVYIIPTSVSYVVVIISSHVLMSYPIAEAIIIIQSSSKLRKTLLGKIFARKRRNCETET